MKKKIPKIITTKSLSDICENYLVVTTYAPKAFGA
jgi:hypothetical protein